MKIKYYFFHIIVGMFYGTHKMLCDVKYWFWIRAVRAENLIRRGFVPIMNEQDVKIFYAIDSGLGKFAFWATRTGDHINFKYRVPIYQDLHCPGWRERYAKLMAGD